MKKILLLPILLIFILAGCEKYKNSTTTINGIDYETFDDGTAGVATQDGFFVGKTKGDIIIPQTIKVGRSSYSVTSIGDRAFQFCINLTSIVIPDGVTKIGLGAFNACYKLKGISIPESVTFMGDGVFGSCLELTNVIIPNCVKTIEKYTFAHCESLTYIVIPNGVTKIGFGAFQGCKSLESIVIPESVVAIENAAFNNCESLKEIYSYNPIPPTFDLYSSKFHPDCILYVPKGAVRAYSYYNSGISRFNIVEME